MDDKTLLILFAFLALLFLSSNGNLRKTICGNLVEGSAPRHTDRCNIIRKSDFDCANSHECSRNIQLHRSGYQTCMEGKCTHITNAANADWGGRHQDEFLDMHENLKSVSDQNDPNNFIRCQQGGGDFTVPYNAEQGESHVRDLNIVNQDPNTPPASKQAIRRVLCDLGYPGCPTGH